MFGSLGAPEIIFILLLALLVFGPRRLPEVGRTLGRAMREFRQAGNEFRRAVDTELTLEEVRGGSAPPPAGTVGRGAAGEDEPAERENPATAPTDPHGSPRD